MNKQPTLEEIALAFKAADVRAKIDAVLAEHGARMAFCWESGWAYLQIQFEEDGGLEKALTIARCAKGKGVRYYSEAEEIAAETKRHRPKVRWEKDNEPSIVSEEEDSAARKRAPEAGMR